MATENIKSVPITNLDSSPVVQNTVGQGAPGSLRSVNGSAPVTSGVLASGTSTYQLARVPSNACVKSVKMWLDAAGTTITGDIGFYYSTSSVDGTPVGDGAGSTGIPTPVNTTSGSQLFGTAVALAAIIEPTEFSGESGNYTGVKRLEPAWKACGLAQDPGGFFDLTFTLTSNAGSAAVVNGQVDYVE